MVFAAPLLLYHNRTVAMSKYKQPIPRGASREERALYFISKAKEKHGETYDYSLVLSSFTKQQALVKIICPKCGPFEQLATNHLAGKGCITCAAKLRMQARYPLHHEAFLQGNKICGSCNQIKSLNHFSNSLKRKDGASGWCKNCENTKKQTKYKNRIRNSNLKKYGINNDQYLELLRLQHYKCKICEVGINEAPGVGRSLGGVLCVDHDHKTNKIRGLLCSRCNTGLGLFYDDVLNLKNAIKYLEASIN